MSEFTLIEIEKWVESTRHDPIRHLERQATEVVLNAIGMSSPYREGILLKGGALMGVVYGSPRQTADLDFTATLEPKPEIGALLRTALDANLPRAAARLGYPDIALVVQSIERRPRLNRFTDADFPALKIKIGYARRGSSQESRLNRGQSPDVIELDFSFNEPVTEMDTVQLGRAGASIQVYSLLDLIAEKLRALLQQESRNRYRRQDIFDIALLIDRFQLSESERGQLLTILRVKCHARRIEPHVESLSQPEVIRRAKLDWETLTLELGEIPPFEERFALVEALYRSLPWELQQ